VVEGRDIGTVVFPDTPVKVFLTADPAERARRRAAETDGDRSQAELELQRRDRLDSTRATSPLTPASDASVLDTTDMSVEEVVDAVVGLAEEAGFLAG
jgi:cytidylate kinase